MSKCEPDIFGKIETDSLGKSGPDHVGKSGPEYRGKSGLDSGYVDCVVSNTSTPGGDIDAMEHSRRSRMHVSGLVISRERVEVSNSKVIKDSDAEERC